MSQQNFEIRFNKARQQLNASLKELEKAIDKKILQASNQINSGSEDTTTLVKNLNSEIVRMQQNLAQLSLKNESLIRQNNKLNDDIKYFRLEGSNLIKAIELDLVSIESIIAGEKND